MLVFDTNVLVYAIDEDSPFHEPCRARVVQAREGSSPAFVTWSICYALLHETLVPRRGGLRQFAGRSDAANFCYLLQGSVGSGRDRCTSAECPRLSPIARGNARYTRMGVIGSLPRLRNLAASADQRYCSLRKRLVSSTARTIASSAFNPAFARALATISLAVS